MTNIIEVKNVSISYRQKGHILSPRSYQVFSGLSFNLKKGETLGVLGRNGAGKSTLLKLLANIYKPDNGEITNFSRKTSLLTLSAGFDLNLNGHDNTLLSGMLMGYEKRQIEAAIDDIREYSELGDFFYQPLKTYSTGMRGRLGFAVATFMTPEVLLVDEVLGVGDESFKTKAKKTMDELINSDQTVVLVSHSMTAMSKLCTRVMWLEDGSIKEIGKPKKVISNYKKSFIKKHTSEV